MTFITSSLFVVFSAPSTISKGGKTHVRPGDSIQVALDSIIEGDTIIVHEGLYLERIIINTNNITLQGDGAILDGSAFPPGQTGPMVTISPHVHGVTIKGLKIQGFIHTAFRLSDSSSDNVIKGNEITSGRGGISLFGSHDNVIKGNAVSGTSLSCIWFTQGSQGNIVKGNVLVGGDNCIRLLGSPNNLILGNTISDGGNGISNEISNSNLIKDNTITQCGNGLNIVGSEDNIIQENKIFFSAGNGIHIWGIIDPPSFPPGLYISVNNMIKENHVFNSGNVDLYWDQGGPGNTWVKNEYETSDPDFLQ